LNELEKIVISTKVRILKEMVMAYLKVLTKHSEGLKKTTKVPVRTAIYLEVIQFG